VLAYEAAVYGLGLVLAAGLIPEWGRWYSHTDHHRTQVDALLHGSLALSTNPAALAHDLTWSEGGVHQVWGLGVPLWRLTFEVVWRVLRQKGFPDMLAFAAALGVAAWLLLRALVEVVCFRETDAPASADRFRVESRWNAATVCWCVSAAGLVLLFPPFITLVHSRFDIYEEVVAYEYVYGVALIASLVLLATSGQRVRFWSLCALAGLGGLVRPTLFFHGVAAVIAGAFVLAWKHRVSLEPRKTRGFRTTVVTGVTLFVIGGGLLWATNRMRFGDGFEFGHRLNVQRFYGSLYATRFDDPFRDEPFFSAARELFGLLFLTKEFSGGSFYLPDFFPGQSPTVRWREMYATTYDVSFFVLLIGSAVVGMACVGKLWRTRKRTTVGSTSPAEDLLPIAALTVFGLLGSAGLLGFYLRNCVISSRYLADLMPGSAALLLAGWLAWGRYCAAHRRAGWLLGGSCVLLVGWLAWEIGRGSSAYGPPRPITWKEVEQRCSHPLPKVTFPKSGRYQSPADAIQTKMPYNGAGWEPETGMVMPCVILFVDTPEFLELEFAPIGEAVTETGLNHLRAKIGLEFLIRETVRKTERGWLVRFKGPTRRQYQRGIQPVFLATVPNTHLADGSAPWRLLRVQWREPDKEATRE
jgi:hypothetical protein